MENFVYHCATKIVFGKDTESLVGQEIKPFAKRVLLHYGQGSIKKSGLYRSIVASLEAEGIQFVELPGVVPNPRVSLVREGIQLCRRHKLTFILAVGGGSVIDSAKAIALGYYYPGDVWDFYARKLQIEQALPVGVVLTIPAAGSEASTGSVITNEAEGRKLSCGSVLIRPKFAIMNPELTKTLPAFQTACGIADMMAHIIERYFTNTKNVGLTDSLCEATLKSIIKNAKLVLKHPDNYDYRAEIMWASTVAHKGLLGTGRIEDWSSHRIEHELSAFYDVAHGAGLAVIVPAWMRFVHKHDLKRFAQYGREVWGLKGFDREVALKSIAATKKFFSQIGLPTTLKELKIDDKRLKEMAEQCTMFGPVGNFVPLGCEEVLKIYHLAR